MQRKMPDTADSYQPLSKPASGLFTCLALHKNALFAGGTNGTLCELEISGNHALVVSTCDIGVPITSLNFNPSHHTLAIGSSQGSIHLYQPKDTAAEGSHKIRLLFDIHFGNFIAVRSLSSSSEYCVTLRESGQLQVWGVENGQLISSTSVGCKSSALGTSPLLNMAAVGTHSGHLYFVDLRPQQQPRIVHVVRVHNQAVRQIAFNANGELVLTASSDGFIFVLNGHPMKNFDVLGYIAASGSANSLSTYLSPEDGSTHVALTLCQTDQSLGSNSATATKLVYFHLPNDFAHSVKYKSQNYELNSEMISKMVLSLDQPVYAATLVAGRLLYAMSQKENAIQKYQIPDKTPKQINMEALLKMKRLAETSGTGMGLKELMNFFAASDAPVDRETYNMLAELSKESALASLESFPGHLLPGGKLLLSPHYKWLATCGGDGRVCIRRLGSPGHVEAFTGAHSFWKGGVLDVSFTPDCQQVISSGFDGTLCCYRLRIHPGQDGHGLDAMNTLQTVLIHGRAREEEAISTMPTWTEQTTVSVASAETEKQEDTAARIEKEIEVAIANDQIYISEITKPPTNATWLDFRQYEVMTEEDKAFATTKRELREELREMRRKLQKMMSDNEGLPQIEKLSRHEFDLDIEEQKRLQAQCEVEVQKLREEKEFENLAKMFLADIIRQECWDDMSVKGRGIVAFNSLLEVYNFPLKDRPREELQELEILKARRRIEIAELTARKRLVDRVLEPQSSSSPTQQLEDERAEKDNADPETSASSQDMLREKSTLMGNQAEELGAETEMFYSQFELSTREQKICEIKLVQDAIYRIKVQYNKEFDEVLARKEMEISKIKEKNKRIRKILDDLNIRDPVYQPELGPIERPEMLLTTTDAEVEVEKFFTPEQQKKMEEEKKLEEERRLRERSDNWRERGLDQMMGGVLEIKKEDELKKDIPIPLFMEEKKEEDWTDEEKKAAGDYQKKVKELEEEREKFRKQLELELRKLQTAVQEGTQAFDEAHNQLFVKKVKTELVVAQLELKIQRLRYSLLQEEEMENREVELNTLIDQKRRAAQTLSKELEQAKRQLDEFRNDYESLLGDDRAHDKAFRREFGDLSVPLIDQLYKHFRKRPRGQKARMIESQAYDANSSNPFSDRPSTARQREEALRALDAAMEELDKSMPENMDPAVWDRLCRYRREKVDLEHEAKQRALTLAEMQEFYQHRQLEESQIKNETDDLEEELNRLRKDKHMFVTDLEVQLLLKQGQVEVDPGTFIPDYTSSLLIHRSVVEDLNKQIRQLSDSKIASMVESKDFRKGIIQLEWEHKKMTMQMEDLHNKMRDIINMKVTREIQLYLTNPAEYDAFKAQELASLEQTILVQKEHHEKLVKEKKRTVKQLKKSIAQLMEKNETLLKELERLNVSVNERRHIHEISGDAVADSDRMLVYKEIVKRRRLVELAKAQSQEVAVLRAEVERLRMRTFAALVQVEH